MSDYKPCKSTHAVELAVVGVRIARPADDSVFELLKEQASTLAIKHNLPGKIQLDPMSLMMGKQVISPGYTTDMLLGSGTVYLRSAPDGSVEEELTIERGAITYRTHEYNRWADVSHKIKNILIPLVEVITQKNPLLISVIELRCIDRFIANDASDVKLSNAIRADSSYVAKELLDKSNMLHQHIGWFENATSENRTLVNVNINLTAEGSKKDLTILQVVSKQGKNGNILRHNSIIHDELFAEFNSLHQKDKEILREILVDDIQEQINLNHN